MAERRILMLIATRSTNQPATAPVSDLMLSPDLAVYQPSPPRVPINLIAASCGSNYLRRDLRSCRPCTSAPETVIRLLARASPGRSPAHLNAELCSPCGA